LDIIIIDVIHWLAGSHRNNGCRSKTRSRNTLRYVSCGKIFCINV